MDTILIDTAAGISSNVLFFSSLAHKVMVIATKEPTSITDAYATMKALYQGYGEKDFQLIVNLVESEREGLNVYMTLRKVTERFLNITPHYIGSIVKDLNLPRAVCHQKALMEVHPDSSASRDFRRLAKSIITEGAVEERPQRRDRIIWKKFPVSTQFH
jgi:flagellar biosynthesis protein FlhG